jgi:hypothetical protein
VLGAFDLLEADGEDLRRLTIEARKRTLAKLLRRPHPGIATPATRARGANFRSENDVARRLSRRRSVLKGLACAHPITADTREAMPRQISVCHSSKERLMGTDDEKASRVLPEEIEK